MNNLKERVAYLRGLAEGLKIDESSNEGKLLKGIIGVLDEFADAIDELDEVQDEISEYLEHVDEDLAELEEDYYDEEDDQDEEFDSEYYEVECPICHDTVVVEEEAFEKENKIVCPNCNNEIEIEFEGMCDCGCNHDHDYQNK